MNRGPMSRLVKVPVKCRNCGKVKYNVVCKNDIPAEKMETHEEVPKKVETNSQPEQKTYKKPKQYNYLKSVVKKQNNMAIKAYAREEE